VSGLVGGWDVLVPVNGRRSSLQTLRLDSSLIRAAVEMKFMRWFELVKNEVDGEIRITLRQLTGIRVSLMLRR